MSNTILDISLTVLYVPICSITFLDISWTEDWCSHICPQLLHQGNISFWLFSTDAIFCFLQYQIQWNQRQWGWCFYSICDASHFLNWCSYYLWWHHCCLVALNTVWYCSRISFSWWSNLASVISSCSCCCASGDKLLFLHWLLTSSLTVLQFWKFSRFCFVEVSATVHCSFATFNCFYSKQLKVY